jgi:protein dithiol:quinone oxidoreductase
MLDNLPFETTLRVILAGDGNCAVIDWTFLGFSIPEQTLALFGATILVCLWQTLRTYPVP